MKESVLLINTPLSEFPQRESEESLPPLGLGQYSRKDVDFSSGNYSNVDDITLNNFISQLRSLNV